MRRYTVSLLALGILWVVPARLTAEDWPQWRGPGRDNVVPAGAVPKQWPKELTKRWQLPVGDSYGSPVIAGSKVYVLARQDNDEIVRCIDLKSGKEDWNKSYPAPYEPDSSATEFGKAPRATPTVVGGRVFTLGVSGILSCFDAKSGKLHWQKTFKDQFTHTAPQYGAAQSPLVHGETVVVHVGGNNKGALSAFNVADGALRWAWDGDGPSYSSPILAKLAGVEQVVALTQNHLVAVAPDNGRLLWKIPFKTPYEQNIPTPAVYKDLLVVSGTEQGLYGLRVEKSGDTLEPKQVWHDKRVSLYLGSPTVAGDRVFGLSERQDGQLFCVAAADGKVIWTGDGRAGRNGTALAAGDVVLMLTTEAELTVLERGADTLKAVARYRVAESPTWAAPAIADGVMVIKDMQNLICYELK